jgi:hypothetical protein
MTSLRMLLPFALLVAAAAPAAAADPPAAYALDTIPRTIAAHDRATCPDVPLVIYAGTSIRFSKPTRVYVGFADHLREMEEVIRDAAIEVYGRAPVRLVHDGTYDCRLVRGYVTLLSEHALGNAIDVEAFEFGPAPAGSDAPPSLRGAFTVSVGRHWKGGKGAAALHSEFLHAVADRIIARRDLFHVVLGPSYPGHENHFHFDLAPYRLVDVFGDEVRL